MRTELRHHPRVDIELPVRLLDADGSAMPGRTINLSRSGALVECDRWTALHCVPLGDQVAPAHQVDIHLELELPAFGGEVSAVTWRCRVIVMRRVALDIYHMGVQFMDLHPADEERLERLIADRAAPWSTSVKR